MERKIPDLIDYFLRSKNVKSLLVKHAIISLPDIYLKIEEYTVG